MEQGSYLDVSVASAGHAGLGYRLELHPDLLVTTQRRKRTQEKQRRDTLREGARSR